MTEWVGADHHFNHANIIKFCPSTRPYNSLEHMNQSMIMEWNHLVAPDDTVYILGDICFGNVASAIEIVSQLSGNKILIRGNHDKKLVKDPAFACLFNEIHLYHEIIHNGIFVVMFHFPIVNWEKSHWGSVHLYGHVHDKASGLESFRATNVGVDSTGRILSKLDDVVAETVTRMIRKP